MIGPTPRVLVVDDDDSVREVTVIALEMVGGWEVIAASGGVEALALADEHVPDAIVLDLMMPDMNGVTTFERLQLQERTRGIPVILLTAKAQVGHQQPWDDIGVAGVISKPFNPMTLADEVAAMLGWER